MVNSQLSIEEHKSCGTASPTKLKDIKLKYIFRKEVKLVTV